VFVDPNLCSTFEAVQYYALLTMVLKVFSLSLFLVTVAQLITAVPSSRKLRRGHPALYFYSLVCHCHFATGNNNILSLVVIQYVLPGAAASILLLRTLSHVGILLGGRQASDPQTHPECSRL